MVKTFDEKLSGFLLVVILPFLLFFMSYYGFESSYTKFKISERPPDFLFTSVYSYRIIPNYLSLYMTDWMEYAISNYFGFVKTLILKNGTPFYHGLFLMNSFFLVVSAVILNLILKLSPQNLVLNVNVRRVFHLLLIFFIIITQYTPSNCDMIALACYLGGVLLTLKYHQTKRNLFYFALLALVVFSTFVRETACLNIAFFAAVFLSVKEVKNKNYRWVWKVIPLVFCFLIPYLGLRMVMNTDETTFVEGLYVADNFSSPFNLIGLFFSVIVLYFMYKLCSDTENRQVFKRYLFFAMPYLGMITLVGLFWEVRLFLPLILSGAIIASHDFKIFTLKQ